MKDEVKRTIGGTCWVKCLFISSFIFLLSSFISAAQPPIDLADFPPEFFPGLNKQSPEKIYLEGLMALYPGRVLDKAPQSEGPATSREPMIETLPRGITYVRLYDLSDSISFIDAHISDPILLIDLRYVSSSMEAAKRFIAYFSLSSDAIENISTPEETAAHSKGSLQDLISDYTVRPNDRKDIVLINQKTSGAIEAAVDALQRTGKIVTVGTRTAGDTGSYGAIPGVEGYYVIDGEVRAMSGPSLLGVGLEPEVPVDVTAAEDFTGYQLLETGYSAEAILRTRLPALDPLEASEDSEEAEETPIDPILQRAVEVVIALQVLGKLPME